MLSYYVALGHLIAIEHTGKDVTVIPPGTSLIAETDWLVMCKEAGGEDKLIASLKLEDLRHVEPEY